MKKDLFKNDLVDLIKNNPCLPVIPLVESEVGGDDNIYTNFTGSLSTSYVGEAAYCDKVNDEGVYQDRDEFEEDYFYWNNNEFNGMNEEKIDKKLKEISDKYFKKVIYVYISPFDPEDL